MKKFRFLLTVVLLVSVSSFYQPAGAQQKTRDEKEKELRMQEEIKAQKRALAEQKKAQEEMTRELEESQKDIDEAMKEAQQEIEAADQYRDMVRIYKRDGNFPRFNSEDFVLAVPNVPDAPFVFHSFDRDDERTTWDFSKSLKENSFSGDYDFEVEQTAENVSMSVNGDCKAGEIRIKIVTPNGKTYSDIVIDEFGNLNWRKSFKISEEENRDKAGKWKFQVNADKATGYFKISLQTY